MCTPIYTYIVIHIHIRMADCLFRSVSYAFGYVCVLSAMLICWWCVACSCYQLVLCIAQFACGLLVRRSAGRLRAVSVAGLQGKRPLLKGWQKASLKRAKGFSA